MADNEKKKYNIKMDPKQPSKKSIQSKMDFDGVFEAYTHKAYRTPWSKFQRHAHKNRKISMYIILAIIVGILLFTQDDKKKDNQSKPKSEQQTIKDKATTPADTSINFKKSK